MDEKSEATHFDNAWGNIDDSPDTEFFIRFLDATRRRMIETARRDPGAVLGHLELAPGQSVLDAGCGVGDLTAIVAGLVSPGGRAIGIDLSDVMIAEAKRRASGNGARPEFERGDVEQLRFADGEFDRTLSTQLLVHVPDPARALDELCRVTRRGGLLILGEMDWDTLVVALDERALARRFTHMFSDGIRNPLIVRELPGMLRERGIGELRVMPQPMLFDSYEFASEWLIGPALRHARNSGALSPDEIGRIERELPSRASKGRFFAASTFYTIVATR